MPVDTSSFPWQMADVNPFDKPRGGTVMVTRDGVTHEAADEASLWRTLTTVETDNEIVWAIEYRDTFDGPIIHRSPHVLLKRAGVIATAIAGNVGS